PPAATPDGLRYDSVSRLALPQHPDHHRPLSLPLVLRETLQRVANGEVRPVIPAHRFSGDDDSTCAKTGTLVAAEYVEAEQAGEQQCVLKGEAAVLLGERPGGVTCLQPAAQLRAASLCHLGHE